MQHESDRFEKLLPSDIKIFRQLVIKTSQKTSSDPLNSAFVFSISYESKNIGSIGKEFPQQNESATQTIKFKRYATLSHGKLYEPSNEGIRGHPHVLIIRQFWSYVTIK